MYAAGASLDSPILKMILIYFSNFVHMDRHSKGLVLGVTLTVAAAACGDSPSGDGRLATASSTAYLLSQEIQSADTSEMLISVLGDLNPQTIDRAQGLAVSGGARGVFSELGYVFVPNNEEFTVTRYQVSEELVLENPVTVSFANFGFTFFGDFYVFGPERAYAIAPNDGMIVVWNPTTMEIIDDAPIADMNRDGFVGRVNLSGRDVNFAARAVAEATGYLVLPVSWADWQTVDGVPLLGVLSVSTSDVRDQKLVTSDCSSNATWALSGRDDRLYIAGAPSWGPYYNHSGTSFPQGAIARFDVGTRDFASGFCQQGQTMTGGHDIGIVLQYAPGRFLLRAIDAEAGAASAIPTYWSDIEFSCSFWDGDIDEVGAMTLAAAPGMGVGGACYGGVFGIDGDAYFNVPTEGFASGIVAKWNGSSMETIFGLDGYPWTFERIR